MKRENSYADRIYTGSIDFLRGAVVTMAEPGGSRYTRVTVRLGRKTYFLADVGRDSITTVVRHRTVRWASDYADRAQAAAQKALTSSLAEAERLAHYAALCARAAQRVADAQAHGLMDADAKEAAGWAVTTATAHPAS